MTQPDAVNSLSRKKVLFQRLCSTVALWAIVLSALFAPFNGVAVAAFLLIIMTLTFAGFQELTEVFEGHGISVFKRTGLTAAVGLSLLFFFMGSPIRVREEILVAWAGMILVVFLAQGLFAENLRDALPAVSATVFGVVYVAGLLGFLQSFYFHPRWQGRLLLLYFILMVKFSDVGAYVVGTLFGKHKMIPRISPGKTWEGFAGALILPGVLSMLFMLCLSPEQRWMSVPLSFFGGLVLGGGAVVGDLIESVFKRGAGMKDSGSRFPGIGGVLDLIDSLLFTGPILYLFLIFY